MVDIKVSISLLLLAFISLSFVPESNGMQCFRRSMIGGNVETFNCPGLFDNYKKAYCCGTELTRYCCKLSKAREHGFRASDSGVRVSGKEVLKGVGSALLFVLFVILGCLGLCCFCVCYLCKSKRLTRGTILGNAPSAAVPNEIGGQSVHVVNQPPPTAQYPTAYPQAQQPTAGYPMYPTNTPTYPPPPPYPTNDPSKQPAYNPYYPQ